MILNTYPTSSIVPKPQYIQGTNQTKNRLTVYLDMDGVVTDFHTAYAKLYNLQYNYNSPAERDINGVRVLKNDYYHLQRMSCTSFDLSVFHIDKEGPDWWAFIQFTPWGHQLMNMICANAGYKYDLILLSCPATFHWSAHGKYHWCIRNFPDVPYISCKARYKYKLANPYSILIDDSQSNVEAFREAGGIAYAFPQHWNENHSYATSTEDRINFINTFLSYL